MGRSGTSCVDFCAYNKEGIIKIKIIAVNSLFVKYITFSYLKLLTKCSAAPISQHKAYGNRFCKENETSYPVCPQRRRLKEVLADEIFPDALLFDQAD